jgi:hypothetical protein
MSDEFVGTFRPQAVASLATELRGKLGDCVNQAADLRVFSCLFRRQFLEKLLEPPKTLASCASLRAIHRRRYFCPARKI